MNLIYRSGLIFCVSLSLWATAAVAEGPGVRSKVEMSQVEIGRRIYQLGEGASGEPVSAILLGNVEIRGSQFTCMNCHRRSGLGGPEGSKYVLPINGPSLLEPRTDIYLPRPAYTERSFAATLRSGKNPNGEHFDPIMPRYNLSGPEMSALFSYLKTLSSSYSPGLTEEELHVATIVSDSVAAGERQAMLSVIEKFFANKNAETRREKKRYQSGPFYQEYRNKAYRRWHLHVWELKGPAESWKSQLEAYYRQQPVFVILSGLINGSWEPVHQFSRENRIPCLLPNTKLPVVEPRNDFYTLYFSKGIFLEAEVLASQLERRSREKKILQIYRSGTAGGAAVDYLSTALEDKEFHDFDLAEGQTDLKDLRQSLSTIKPDRIILWLSADDLLSLSVALDMSSGYTLSSTLLDGELKALPESLRHTGELIHPFVLPVEQRQRFLRVAAWMKVNKVPQTDPLLQGQTYYACMLLNAGLKHIKRFFYREFFLDLLDHGERMADYSGNYPRLSFGPEQRFLAKGAYLIDLESNQSEWLVPGH